MVDCSTSKESTQPNPMPDLTKLLSKSIYRGATVQHKKFMKYCRTNFNMDISTQRKRTVKLTQLKKEPSLLVLEGKSSLRKTHNLKQEFTNNSYNTHTTNSTHHKLYRISTLFEKTAFNLNVIRNNKNTDYARKQFKEFLIRRYNKIKQHSLVNMPHPKINSSDFPDISIDTQKDKDQFRFTQNIYLSEIKKKKLFKGSCLPQKHHRIESTHNKLEDCFVDEAPLIARPSKELIRPNRIIQRYKTRNTECFGLTQTKTFDTHKISRSHHSPFDISSYISCSKYERSKDEDPEFNKVIRVVISPKKQQSVKLM